MQLEQALFTFFGYKQFRTGQKEVINELLHKRDVFAMLPTGTGKSICYQLPALITDGVTIVVSPLLSLMEDQVQQLKSEGIKSVVALNSFIDQSEREEVLYHLDRYKLVYISPEMLQSSFVQAKLYQAEIAYLVVDEAHCISQWGHDFRPDYLKLGEVKEKLGHPPCLAITATATQEVREDIMQQLNMMNPVSIIYSVDRPTITFMVEKYNGIQDKMQRVKELVDQLNGPGMIYFSSRIWAENVARALIENGIERVAYYHGGLKTEDRLLIQQQFMNGQLDIICCTSAFGMGINKKNIRYVLHFHYPAELESYVQEIGRAGRDGEPSVAILLYSKEDRALIQLLLEAGQISDQQLTSVLLDLQTISKLDYKTEMKLMEKWSLTEVTWRVIRYQLEEMKFIRAGRMIPFSVESVLTAIQAEQQSRFHTKKRKVEAFEQWLSTKSCRRKRLLRYFSEELSDRPTNCCDNCEASLTAFMILGEKEKQIELPSWQSELRAIFQLGES